MRTSRRSLAFTLVELIVVVAVIAALAVIAFPVLARVIENSRRATCKSNLHQIYLAVELYRQDYDGIDPDKGARLSHSQMGLPHFTSIYAFQTQYVKSDGVLFCPSYSPRRRGVGSSYNWALYSSELVDPSQDWEAIAALRGPDYPLVMCMSHNGPDIPKSTRSSSEVMYYHVLRIGGRIDVKNVPASEPLTWTNW